MAETVVLDIDGVGPLPIALTPGNAPRARAAFAEIAARRAPCKLHRAEPHPLAGSAGPPYALCQFTVQDDSAGLATLAHEGTAKIGRGAVCLIGSSSDVFVSLARDGEHDGWEASMTVFGRVAEDDLARILEDKVLAKPIHSITHPQYGTVMSMLKTPLPCTLRR